MWHVCQHKTRHLPEGTVMKFFTRNIEIQPSCVNARRCRNVFKRGAYNTLPIEIGSFSFVTPEIKEFISLHIN